MSEASSMMGGEDRERNESISMDSQIGMGEEPMNPARIGSMLRQKRLVFKCIIDIRDAIISQLTDKVSVIPFCIRQFCKVLYSEVNRKWPKVTFSEAITLVSEFLFSQWLLKAMLIEPHLEGIIKEF